MDSYIRQCYCQTRRIIEWSIIGGLFFFQFSPITNITVRFIFLLVFLLSCLFQKSFHQINNVRFLILISLTTIFLIFYHGLAVAKDFFIFCYGILSVNYFTKQCSFSGNIVYKYFIYVIIPLSFLNFLLYHNVYYLPFTTGRVNIIGKDVTKHSTAIVGTLLFVGAAYNLLKSKVTTQKKDLLFLIIGIYFVFFSGSRSCLLALIATVFLYFINRNNYKQTITYIYFFTMFVLVYFFEYIQDYVTLINNEFILDLIGAKNFKNYGVTSGRVWLWDYHWNSFVDSPYYLGEGRAVTDFKVNDYIPSLRIKAPAGSESPFTGMIACYGIIAIIPIGILLYLSYYAIKRKNLIATCIIFIAIYNGIMGVYLIHILQAYPILLYLLYFSSFNSNEFSYKYN